MRLILDILISLCAVSSLALGLVYSLTQVWWTTLLGRAMFERTMGFALILCFAAFRTLTTPPRPTVVPTDYVLGIVVYAVILFIEAHNTYAFAKTKVDAVRSRRRIESTGSEREKLPRILRIGDTTIHWDPEGLLLESSS